MTEQQQPEAVPFCEMLEATDRTAGLPDGQYQLQFIRPETYRGKKYQSDEDQDKLRFVFLVLAGAEQGAEFWQIENLPPVRNGKRLVNKKSGVHKFLGMLRGKPLADGENVSPASLVGTQGFGIIADSKLTSFFPQQFQPPQPQQPLQQQPQPPGNGQHPQQPVQGNWQSPQQPAAYSEPLTPQQQQNAWADTQQQAVERFE